MPENTFKIVALDDDPLFLSSLKRTLRKEPYTLLTTTEPEEALQQVAGQDIALVLLDLRMPKRDGLEVLEEMVALSPQTTIIMLSGFGNIELTVRAVKLGAADFLEKPCPPQHLCKILAKYHALWQPQHQGPERKQPAAKSGSFESGKNRNFDFPALVGSSPPIIELKNLIARIAPSDAPVLILGETGTGKEVIAKAIHHHSTRRNNSFCVVDCAALNDNVLESELFGHEKGAFTGADKPMPGLIRTADKGTLFLDEVGELPVKMQAKLLRTLQEYEVRPVGSAKRYPVDIRIIAATNRNLEAEIRRGEFRTDLYFRISAIPILSPPLRERASDILPLARYILAQLQPSSHRSLSEEAVAMLRNYHWPGNVRELENVLRRAAALAEQEVIQIHDLPEFLAQETINTKKTEQEYDSMHSYEATALENALTKTSNNRRQAALLLGISEATLYRKMKQFGLS